MISAQQYRKLMREYEKRANIGASSAKAGVDRKTGSKYIHGAAGPQEARAGRHWRTRPDAFEGVWPEVERRLQREPRLMAKTLWEELLREHPGEFREGQRRSFERRIKSWKLRHGAQPELYFTQEHIAGERLQIDWVDCNRLGVKIGGEPFAHKLAHVVLPYSNWEWVQVCRSESLLSLKCGLQSALWKMGGVPAICQSDNSSAATHSLSPGRSGREYNARYLGLLAHYGMRPGLIGVGDPHQNGDVESAHHHLLTAIEQSLLLRGSAEFADRKAYEEFLVEMLEKRNASRSLRWEMERSVLAALPALRLPEYEEEQVRVSREAIARVGKQGYSVPARWAGRPLRARITEMEIAFYDGAHLVEVVEKRGGDHGIYVNWRHILPALLRKPGALRRWRYRQQMYPGLLWRELYDSLQQRYSEGRAEREYLGVLSLALEHGLGRLEELIGAAGGVGHIGLDSLRQELASASKVVVVDFHADLAGYDAMISGQQSEEVHHG